MSEPREHLFVPYCELQEGAELTDAFTIAKSYYLKSEVDKVIAEKDTEIVELKKQVHDYAQGLYVMQARAEKEIKHANYKRCLAMAMWCDTKADWYYSLGEPFIDCVQFYIRWRDKWLELAEKLRFAGYMRRR